MDKKERKIVQDLLKVVILSIKHSKISGKVILILTVTSFIVCLQLLPWFKTDNDRYNVFVKRVVDGDTFVDSKNKKYRLIGVDTPELARGKRPEEPLAEEARKFTSKMINHKKVRIEFDTDRKDRYNRYLVYVYTPGGDLLNFL